MCRLLTGMWQVSGAHGPIDREAALEAMFAYHDAGHRTWDLADHYGPAEDLAGEFRRRLKQQRGELALQDVQFFTKWVPQPGPVSRGLVERAVERSLRRMDVEALDMLQFHWWEYADEAYLDALMHLAALKEQGLIRHLALTNFDTAHLRVIVERGIPIVSNQVQYSLIDRRPEVAMAPFCKEHGIGLLTYGTVGGGLLSQRYLGAPEPGRFQLDTASLHKYKQMVDAWGGWSQLQRLLTTLDAVAERHDSTIANVAVRYVLDRPAVAGVIIGARLGVSEHIAEAQQIESLRLDAADVLEIEAVLTEGNDLYALIGDCGDEYRR
jgi:aryl-alcohol dehydrogenase-like predicted oxidoreductase